MATSIADHIDILRRPGGGGAPLQLQDGVLSNVEDGTVFPIRDGIPQMHLDDVEAIETQYEKWAMGGSDHTAVGYQFEAHYARVHAQVRQLLAGLPATATVADIGCGHGELTKDIAESATVFGVDLAQVMLLRALKNNLVPLRAGACSLPFADQVFDAVVAAEMVQHLAELDPFFNELTRVTKPGGRIIVSTINRRSIARRFNRWIKGMSHVDVVRLRAIDEFGQAIAALPVTVEEVFWVMWPLSWVPRSRGLDFPFQSLAQNFIIVLKRA